MKIRRIAVIGNCGSGKTTVSKRLSSLSGLPIYYLDDLFWNVDWTPTKGGEGIIRFWLYVCFFPLRRRREILNQLKSTTCSTVRLCGHREIEYWLNTFKFK